MSTPRITGGRPQEADLPQHSLCAHTIQFTDAEIYRRWAQFVDAEAPGLAGQLLTVDRGDGSREVVLRLVNPDGRLTAEGIDVLRDVARRVGVGAGQTRPPVPTTPVVVPTKRRRLRFVGLTTTAASVREALGGRR
jgi:hypothetical protein